ncbi:hypothetical protein GN958_ATG20044 [Phytophthora infestans]|uniref:Uncharacterized protein n=1 Tax=Phytophthora infestans TaxID=4787 RepID=A0A8S9TQM3_PHYIN|nr:hypothetical protein GN958_ATG20044 [Phytophthora infestans]
MLSLSSSVPMPPLPSRRRGWGQWCNIKTIVAGVIGTNASYSKSSLLSTSYQLHVVGAAAGSLPAACKFCWSYNAAHIDGGDVAAPSPTRYLTGIAVVAAGTTSVGESLLRSVWALEEDDRAHTQQTSRTYATNFAHIRNKLRTSLSSCRVWLIRVSVRPAPSSTAYCVVWPRKCVASLALHIADRVDNPQQLAAVRHSCDAPLTP